MHAAVAGERGTAAAAGATVQQLPRASALPQGKKVLEVIPKKGTGVSLEVFISALHTAQELEA